MPSCGSTARRSAASTCGAPTSAAASMPPRGRRSEFAGRGGGCDAVFVVADGLSPLAVHRHAVAVLERAWQALAAEGWRLAPVVVAGQARVALGDEIGALLGAEQVAILIGERPGSPPPTAWGSTSPSRRGSGAPTRSATASPTSARKDSATGKRPGPWCG